MIFAEHIGNVCLYIDRTFGRNMYFLVDDFGNAITVDWAALDCYLVPWSQL